MLKATAAADKQKRSKQAPIECGLVTQPMDILAIYFSIVYDANMRAKRGGYLQ